MKKVIFVLISLICILVFVVNFSQLAAAGAGSATADIKTPSNGATIVLSEADHSFTIKFYASASPGVHWSLKVNNERIASDNSAGTFYRTCTWNEKGYFPNVEIKLSVYADDIHYRDTDIHYVHIEYEPEVTIRNLGNGAVTDTLMQGRTVRVFANSSARGSVTFSVDDGPEWAMSRYGDTDVCYTDWIVSETANEAHTVNIRAYDASGTCKWDDSATIKIVDSWQAFLIYEIDYIVGYYPNRQILDTWIDYWKDRAIKVNYFIDQHINISYIQSVDHFWELEQQYNNGTHYNENEWYCSQDKWILWGSHIEGDPETRLGANQMKIPDSEDDKKPDRPYPFVDLVGGNYIRIYIDHINIQFSTEETRYGATLKVLMHETAHTIGVIRTHSFLYPEIYADDEKWDYTYDPNSSEFNYSVHDRDIWCAMSRTRWISSLSGYWSLGPLYSCSYWETRNLEYYQQPFRMGLPFWDHYKWTLESYSESAISRCDFGERNDVLKFYKHANWHSQVSKKFVIGSKIGSNSITTVASVDFYGDAVYSWSWAPCLKVYWEDQGYTAWIRKEAGSYAWWGVTGYTSAETPSKMFQDRWYTMKIYTVSSSSATDIYLKIRDVTNNGDWQTLYHDEVDYQLSGDVFVYLGTGRNNDYTSPGFLETYYYDNFYFYYF